MKSEKTKRLQDALREVREQCHNRIVAELRGTTRTYRAIAWKFGVSEQLVYLISRVNGLSRSRPETAQVISLL